MTRFRKSSHRRCALGSVLGEGWAEKTSVEQSVEPYCSETRGQRMSSGLVKSLSRDAS